MSTTKSEINDVMTEIDVLCRLAVMLVRSHAPIGCLDDDDRRKAKDIEAHLESAPRRFRALVRTAQKTGWAAK